MPDFRKSGKIIEEDDDKVVVEVLKHSDWVDNNSQYYSLVFLDERGTPFFPWPVPIDESPAI